MGHSEDTSKRKSFYKREVQIVNPRASKHLKTIEKEWDPVETKKSSLFKEDGRDFQTKYEWNRKKRSATESNAKKPVRMLPSPNEIRHPKIF